MVFARHLEGRHLEMRHLAGGPNPEVQLHSKRPDLAAAPPPLAGPLSQACHHQQWDQHCLTAGKLAA